MPPSLGKLEDVTGLYQEVRAEKRELEEKVTVLTKALCDTVLTKAHCDTVLTKALCDTVLTKALTTHSAD